MTEQHTVYLALGSNVGDRAHNLHTALRALRDFATGVETSFLYVTPPAYVTDQPEFLNAACRITTQLAPHALLAALKQIEQRMGRAKTVRFGPRNIDLDILFYDDLQLASDTLTIPHPRLAERGFVLTPLQDLAPAFVHPILGKTVRALMSALHEAPLPKVMPVRNGLWQWGQKTYIMGIINVTPDSFSGDGLWTANPSATDQVIERAVAQATQMVADGADCLDIGGQSTRPGHQVIAVEEEIARTEPVIRAIAQQVTVPLSIDTFRAPVAQAALAAGASMINDVWGLTFDPRLGQVAAEQETPLVVMHNRTQNADPAYQHLPPQPGAVYTDLIGEITAELQRQLATAQHAGLPRWLLIADPGIGFGKTPAQHLALLRHLGELKGTLDYPLLIGASRKSFMGNVLSGLPPEARDEATLALGVLALERGANLLRVHNVPAMSRAARMADAILAQG
jgi:dihydroneopterin aldolase/2-amino-4-hydroxy-6-hydroxymethyldihydropteridine diphosphokinase/dihydropteroate synthase